LSSAKACLQDLKTAKVLLMYSMFAKSSFKRFKVC
jgi:hypothetical protein